MVNNLLPPKVTKFLFIEGQIEWQSIPINLRNEPDSGLARAEA